MTLASRRATVTALSYKHLSNETKHLSNRKHIFGHVHSANISVNKNFSMFTMYRNITIGLILIHIMLHAAMDRKWKSLILCSFLMFSTSLNAILISKSKNDVGEFTFHVQSSIFYSDCMKCLAMFVVLRCKRNSDSIKDDISNLSCRDLILTCLPAVVFAIQNNLVYYALRLLDPVTFQLVNNVKVAVTGIVSYLILNQRLHAIQWYALIFLCLGLNVAFICDNGSDSSNVFFGSLIVLICQTMGAVGLVINEFVVKKTNTDVSFETKNIMLYVSGMLLNVLFWEPSSFIDFDFTAWFLSCYASLLGLSIAYVIKHTDSITRNLVGAGSLIISNIFTSIENNKFPHNSCILSTAIVVLSMLQYYKVRLDD